MNMMPITTRHPIHRLPLLSAAACQQIRTELYAMKAEWIRRNPYLPFYTLGVASYLDAAKDVQAYYQQAQDYNTGLRARFSGLYQQLGDALSDHLAAPINYNPTFALPGFHIYLFCVVFEQAIASIHVDSQYQHLNWDQPTTDFTQPISFTLPISLPQSGGGLNVWDIHHAELMDRDAADLPQLMQTREKVFYPYQAGTLMIHSGWALHQAAPANQLQPEDDRITLQGHGLFSQGQWQLYW
jgi:hypothetical protein